ncbi:MAG: hypothetical protein K2X86_00645 [Cytophagaceae bacterium]|nr:hypothetical protein [Cytophagaceae bacterium]
MHQERLAELLKKKGIGPQGSKSLKTEELEEIAGLFKNPEVSLTTKATMLTALLILPPTDEEKSWLEKLKASPDKFLPQELTGYIKETSNPFLSLIKKIIGKNDLTKEECESGMSFLFSKDIPEYLKGSFLEAERLKRESFIENNSFLNYLYSQVPHREINMPVLIDIADSYDGSNRSKNFSLFTAALLGSIGFPTIVHGIDEVAPKEGYTSHKILKYAGIDPLISLDQAIKNLENSSVSWTYLDQKIFFPDLYEMKRMRKEMVKRPFLATFEKLLQPIRAKNGNHIVTGYTHPHYKEELVKQLKEQKQCAQAIILKGMEGSTHMSLSKSTTCVLYNGQEISDSLINPVSFGISEMEEKIDKSVSEKESYEEGIAALRGEKNYARQNIIYLALVILNKFNLMDSEKALTTLSHSLDSGKALSHWEKF